MPLLAQNSIRSEVIFYARMWRCCNWKVPWSFRGVIKHWENIFCHKLFSENTITDVLCLCVRLRTNSGCINDAVNTWNIFRKKTQLMRGSYVRFNIHHFKYFGYTYLPSGSLSSLFNHHVGRGWMGWQELAKHRIASAFTVCFGMVFMARYPS